MSDLAKGGITVDAIQQKIEKDILAIEEGMSKEEYKQFNMHPHKLREYVRKYPDRKAKWVDKFLKEGNEK